MVFEALCHFKPNSLLILKVLIILFIILITVFDRQSLKVISVRVLPEKTEIPTNTWTSLVAQWVKNPAARQETWVWSLGWEDPLGKGTATKFSIWPGEFHGLENSIGLQRVRHD